LLEPPTTPIYPLPLHDALPISDGTKAKEGKNTNLTFTVMPDEEEAFIVSADVTDFEMDPINISATPASMSIDDPDLGDMKSNIRSEEHTSELQSRFDLVCRLLL